MTGNLRKKVVEEIISSEYSYLQQLHKIETFFSEPLKERTYLPKDVHCAIFSQLSVILEMNKKLLEEVLESTEENVGQAFLHLGPFLKVYSSYAHSFQRGISLLQEWQTRNEEFRTFVGITESRPEVQSKLPALLITPIQRIPRYRLLLEELLKCTDVSCSSFKYIKDALVLVSDVAEHINKSVDEAQVLQRLLVLQRALRNQQPSIIAPGRKLLREGILNKVSRKGKGSQPRMFFLFSDMILYSKVPSQTLHSAKTNLCFSPDYLKPNSLECCCVLPLRYCRVMTVFGSDKHGITFRLQCSDEDLLLYSTSAAEGQEWISAIKNAVDQALKRRRTLRKASSKKRTIRRPAFQKFKSDDDDDDDNKLSCQTSELSDVGEKSPNNEARSVAGLKSHLLKAKECLTPPKTWITPRSRVKKRIHESSGLHVGDSSFSETVNHIPTSKRILIKSSCDTEKFSVSPRLGRVRYNTSSAAGAHVISPLAICSSDGFSETKSQVTDSEVSDYQLRKNFKVSFISPTKDSPEISDRFMRKKRPLSDLLSPRYFKNKRAKNE